MSLLMDALKKAEEAKRQSEATGKSEPQEQPADAGVSPSEAAAAAGESTTTSRGLPELPERLELLDVEFHTPAETKPKAESAAVPPPKRAPAADTERDRAAAQNLFEAKQASQRRSFPLVVGSVTLLAVGIIGTYFWLQMQSAGGVRTAPVAARTAQTPAPAQVPAAAPAPIASASTATPIAEENEPPKPPATPAAQNAVTAAALPRSPAAPPAPAARTSAVEPESPIRITTSRPKMHPQIASAYQAFQAGDFSAAQRDYQAVLKSDPKNTDALHGLAALNLQQGRFDAAESYYLRILEADPKDNAAVAGLIGLKGQVDPIQSESRLKNLLASQPESPFLNFALGNLFAQQGRWADAQQAYFRAYAADSDNPDYQFNLAVSLDQMHQAKLALQYYQGALSAAAQRPAAFDRNQVAGRVSELQK